MMLSTWEAFPSSQVKLASMLKGALLPHAIYS